MNEWETSIQKSFVKHTQASLRMLFLLCVHELVVNTNTRTLSSEGEFPERREEKNVLRDHLFDDLRGIVWCLEIFQKNLIDFLETNCEKL